MVDQAGDLWRLNLGFGGSVLVKGTFPMAGVHNAMDRCFDLVTFLMHACNEMMIK